MAATPLTVQTLAVGGTTPTFAAATATQGDSWPADTKTFLVVKNGGGSSITVTIPSAFPDRDGAVHQDKAVTVGAGAEKWIPVDPAVYGDADGLAKAVCSAVTSVTIAAIHLP